MTTIYDLKRFGASRNKSLYAYLSKNGANFLEPGLQGVVVSQLTNTDVWDWGREQPKLYLGPYNLRRRGVSGAAKVATTENDAEISIRFDPAIQPGEQVNIVFRSFNPDAGIYQWATTFIPNGVEPITSDGPTLRTSVYRNEYFR